MKTLIATTLLLLSFQTLACPTITGTFYDPEDEMNTTITQEGCKSTTWTDDEGTTTLIADGVERVLESDGEMTAFAKVSFTKDELVIDIRMDWGGNNDYDLPVRWLTSYRIDKFNNMEEKIIPFKEDGTQQGTDYVTFRRIN
jgi:hypothetical protein